MCGRPRLSSPPSTRSLVGSQPCSAELQLSFRCQHLDQWSSTSVRGDEPPQGASPPSGPRPPPRHGSSHRSHPCCPLCTARPAHSLTSRLPGGERPAPAQRSASLAGNTSLRLPPAGRVLSASEPGARMVTVPTTLPQLCRWLLLSHSPPDITSTITSTERPSLAASPEQRACRPVTLASPPVLSRALSTT